MCQVLHLSDSMKDVIHYISAASLKSKSVKKYDLVCLA